MIFLKDEHKFDSSRSPKYQIHIINKQGRPGQHRYRHFRRQKH